MGGLEVQISPIQCGPTALLGSQSREQEERVIGLKFART